MVELLISVALGALVGASLGALGAGGSILTVPALILFLDLSPHEAAATSLIVVGVTAAAAAIAHYRRGAVDLGAALRFAAAGLVASLAGSYLSGGIDARALTLAFAAVMVVAAMFMWRGASNGSASDAATQPNHVIPRTLAAGSAVGVLTGVFGIGGGFLAVPALTFALGLGITTAVGTSLVVIAINAAVALVPRLAGGAIEPAITAYFVIGGLIGGLIGTRIAHRVDPARLKRAFALLVLIAALALVLNAFYG